MIIGTLGNISSRTCNAEQRRILQKAIQLAMISLSTCCENKWYIVQHSGGNCGNHYLGVPDGLHKIETGCCPFTQETITNVLIALQLTPINCTDDHGGSEGYQTRGKIYVNRDGIVDQTRALFDLADTLIEEAAHAAKIGEHEENGPKTVSGVNPKAVAQCVTALEKTVMLGYGVAMPRSGHLCEPH
ncbi:MAG TPA: hypothetical protein ENL23_04460 [Candidatus Acetothermia bacterium]|nr:hypothetical protein [Candidatus Acetothermia bacterium]